MRTRQRPRPYVVGYGKPPKHSQFKPGRSGNPKGRPKHARGLRTIVKEVLLEKVPIRTNGKDRRVTRLEALVLKQVELAGKGEARALEKLIQLYMTLVPETEAEPMAVAAAELTQTDAEVLAELGVRAAKAACDDAGSRGSSNA